MSPSRNRRPSFSIPIVLVYDLLERLPRVPLHVLRLSAGPVELDYGRAVLLLLRGEKDADGAAAPHFTSGSMQDGDFPAFGSVGVHDAEEVNTIDLPWSLGTDDTSYSVGCLRIHTLHVSRPRFLKSAYGSLDAFAENI